VEASLLATGTHFDISVRRTSLECNFDLILGGLHQGEIFILTLESQHAKHAIKSGNLGSNTAFVIGLIKIMENLDQFGRSQQL
jgi:hypothetical protein